MFGTGTGQIVQLLCLPFITRFYGADHLGHYGSLLAISAILSVFVGMRLEMDYARANREERSILIGSFIGFSAATSFLIFLVLLSGILGSVLPMTDQSVWGQLLLALLAYSLALFHFNSIVLASEGEITRLAVFKGMRAGGTSIVQALAPFFLPATASLLAVGDLILRSFTSASFFRYRKGIIFDWTRVFNWRRIQVVGAAFLNQLSSNAPYLIIGYVWGGVFVGFYFLAQRSLGGATALLGQSVAMAYVTELARDCESADRKAVWRRAITITSKGIAFSTPLLLLVGVAGYYLIADIFGDEWEQFGTSWLLITPLYIFRFAFSPISQTLTYLGFSGQQFVWEVVRVILVSTALFAPILVDMAFHQAMLLFSFVAGLCYGGLLLVIFFRTGR